MKKGDPETGAAGARRRRNALSDLRREVAIMRTLRHRNIVTLQACTYSWPGLPWTAHDRGHRSTVA